VARRAARSALLDEAVAMTGYHRKTLIRRFTRPPGSCRPATLTRRIHLDTLVPCLSSDKRRLYFVRRGQVLVVLLSGGAKSTQRRDILRARALATRIGDDL